MEEHLDSQCDAILKHLEEGKTITGIEALNMFQCFSLAQRIHDLKKRGHNIDSKMIKTKSNKRVAEYKLIIPEPINKTTNQILLNI